MIPKTIHYCWFGGNPLPQLAKDCIASWKKYLPEYELVEWNESNFPFAQFPLAQEALENRKFAFVSDVCRLYAIKEFGGIYMDTDVEVLKPLDAFLHHAAFSGFENNDKFKNHIGDILIDVLDEQLAKNQVVYTGGVDENRTTDSEQSDS